jgi:hypothetical protein
VIDADGFSGARRTETSPEAGRMTRAESNDEAAADEHLADLADGCGCAEVWEHLSERREADRVEASTRTSGEAASREADD